MTTQTVELDPETGLAALPEGYFWRVVSSNRYLTLKLIESVTDTEIRRVCFFWKEESTRTRESVIMEEFYDSHQLLPTLRTKENVAFGLSHLSKKMLTSWKAQQDQWDLMNSFWGDYPPNNLNSV